jgi:hypothetical protein
MEKKFKIVTLCGSTKFKDEFIAQQKRLTLEGNIVISVGLFGHSGDEEVWTDDTKQRLDDMHKAKIDMADEIFVINVGGYIGESTKKEIEYAGYQNKIIKCLVPIKNELWDEFLQTHVERPSIEQKYNMIMRWFERKTNLCKIEWTKHAYKINEMLNDYQKIKNEHKKMLTWFNERTDLNFNAPSSKHIFKMNEIFNQFRRIEEQNERMIVWMKKRNRLAEDELLNVHMKKIDEMIDRKTPFNDINEKNIYVDDVLEFDCSDTAHSTRGIVRKRKNKFIVIYYSINHNVSEKLKHFMITHKNIINLGKITNINLEKDEK